MHEIDNAAFGRFLAARRKEKGFTQKDLAARLFVSDKAVSKWERGLSMPDISLLIPLAESLDVTVVELLEGRRSEGAGPDAARTEELVRRALTLSGETPEKQRQTRRRRGLLFGGCALLSLLELAAAFLSGRGFSDFAVSFWTFEPLSLIFGAYFWCFARERLPAYYDENRITSYSDGFFRMNIPGMRFHNGNWPHIVRVGRIWSAVSLIAAPPVCLLLSRFALVADKALLLIYLGGLFVPMLVVGKKYE